MASCVMEVPGATLLEKIENFFSDPQYKETVENSVTYNSRLCNERRMRMPFLDSQTGLAQNHSNLFMSARQRMPGFLQGQVYTYPSKRWRKKRRQYLSSYLHPRRGTVLPPKEAGDDSSEHLHTISTVENPAAVNNSDEASKDSIKEEVVKVQDWYYDEQDMLDMDGFDEPDPDSDYDYEESFRKKKKRSKPARASGSTESPRNSKAKVGPGRGRKKVPTIFPDPSDPEKPFGCDICGARYKTRPGLTYHITHSHKNKENEEEDSNHSSAGAGGGPVGGAVGGTNSSTGNGVNAGFNAGGTGESQTEPRQMQQVQQTQQSASVMRNGDAQKGPDGGPGGAWNKFQDSYLTFLKSPEPSPKRGKGFTGSKSAPSSAGTSRPTTPAGPGGEDMELSNDKKMCGPPEESAPSGPLEERRNKANPSPYCDFCLGDASLNKKSGTPEELVSCSDCGRSGHPTCLQFTPNMIISVRKYRWQCIECKCCSICGTSDNDDQLLFCDDCDRGYHMYCLSPPLTSPPEGSWSCRLCLAEFHNK